MACQGWVWGHTRPCACAHGRSSRPQGDHALTLLGPQGGHGKSRRGHCDARGRPWGAPWPSSPADEALIIKARPDSYPNPRSHGGHGEHFLGGQGHLAQDHAAVDQPPKRVPIRHVTRVAISGRDVPRCQCLHHFGHELERVGPRYGLGFECLFELGQADGVPCQLATGRRDWVRDRVRPGQGGQRGTAWLHCVQTPPWGRLGCGSKVPCIASTVYTWGGYWGMHACGP